MKLKCDCSPPMISVAYKILWTNSYQRQGVIINRPGLDNFRATEQDPVGMQSGFLQKAAKDYYCFAKCPAILLGSG